MQYTAYCFATGCDGDLFAEDNEQFALDPIVSTIHDGHDGDPFSQDNNQFIPDPIISTIHDVHDVQQNRRPHPRDYFLDALVVRAEQVRAGWESIVAALQRFKDESVSFFKIDNRAGIVYPSLTPTHFVTMRPCTEQSHFLTLMPCRLISN